MEKLMKSFQFQLQFKKYQVRKDIKSRLLIIVEDFFQIKQYSAENFYIQEQTNETIKVDVFDNMYKQFIFENKRPRHMMKNFSNSQILNFNYSKYKVDSISLKQLSVEQVELYNKVQIQKIIEEMIITKFLKIEVLFSLFWKKYDAIIRQVQQKINESIREKVKQAEQTFKIIRLKYQKQERYYKSIPLQVKKEVIDKYFNKNEIIKSSTDNIKTQKKLRGKQNEKQYLKEDQQWLENAKIVNQFELYNHAPLYDGNTVNSRSPQV